MAAARGQDDQLRGQHGRPAGGQGPRRRRRRPGRAGRRAAGGADGNLWWRTGHTLHTPSLDLGVLAGITRTVLRELAPGLGLKVLEGVFTAEDLAAADEAFLSSSTRELMPVIEVDGAPIAGGHPVPTTADLQAALRDLAPT